MFLIFLFRIRWQELKSEIEQLSTTQLAMDVQLSAFKAKYEELLARDLTLDKQFRAHFSEIVSAAVVDQAHRIYKFVEHSKGSSLTAAVILSSDEGRRAV